MPTPQERDRFYDAAMIGLRALEAREGRGRRFGPDADATWATFAGGLHSAGDRVELLLRDAAASWGVAFSAREIFGLEGTASDDAFDTTWAHKSGKRLLEASGPVSLAAAVAALGLTALPAARAGGADAAWREPLARLGAASRLVVAGLRSPRRSPPARTLAWCSTSRAAASTPRLKRRRDGHRFGAARVGRCPVAVIAGARPTGGDVRRHVPRRGARPAGRTGAGRS